MSEQVAGAVAHGAVAVDVADGVALGVEDVHVFDTDDDVAELVVEKAFIVEDRDRASVVGACDAIAVDASERIEVGVTYDLRLCGGSGD